MTVLEIFFLYWAVINIPVGTVIITANCVDGAKHDKLNLLFWPLLVNSLCKKLNKIGTVIATLFISIFFAPAIITYYMAGGFVGLVYLGYIGFYKLFKRKD